MNSNGSVQDLEKEESVMWKGGNETVTEHQTEEAKLDAYNQMLQTILQVYSCGICAHYNIRLHFINVLLILKHS